MTDQDVEAADVVADPGGEGGDGGGVGDVEAAEPHGGEPPGAELRGGRLPAGLVPRREHHAQPLLREARRQSVPDAPVRPRHHRHCLPRPPRRRPDQIIANRACQNQQLINKQMVSQTRYQCTRSNTKLSYGVRVNINYLDGGVSLELEQSIDGEGRG